MKQQLPTLGVWLSRIPSLLLSIAVLGTLCAPAIIQLTGRSTDPSFIDNRPPARLPPLPNSLPDLETFRVGLIKFVDDNFGLRAEMVRLNVLTHAWLGVSSVPGLIMGKDGWFFLKTDHDIVDQFRGLNRFTDQELDTWIDTVDIYRRWLETQGIAFMIVVAPNQQTVYPDYMPTYANRVWPETRLDQVSRRLRERQSQVALLDLRSSLWANRKLGLLYNKYESHWNALGGFVGYSAIMALIEKTFPGAKTLQMSEFTVTSHRGRWNIPPMVETQPVLAWNGQSRVTASETVARVNGQPVTYTTTNIAGGPDVLVYGDSFAEAGLLLYFNQSFKSTMFVPSNHSPFPTALIKKYHPNLVMFELVERYLARPLSPTAELDSDLMRAGAPSYQNVEPSVGIVGGYVEGVVDQNGDSLFSGWAVDQPENAPATAIYAYDDDRLVAASRLVVPRPDIAKGMTDKNAGFRILVPRSVDIREAGRRLRFFSTNPSHKIYEVAVYRTVPPQIVEILKQRAGP